MIVLDEHLNDARLEDALSHWYPGQIIHLKTLRPKTLIKDDAVATLLFKLKQPTFVTINWTDFWRQISADKRYCVVCFALSLNQADKLSDLLRSVFKLEQFKTKNSRMGKVARVLHTSLQFYSVNDPTMYSVKIS